MKKTITRTYQGEEIAIGRLSPRLNTNDYDIGETVMVLEVFNPENQLHQRYNDMFIFKFDARTNEYMLDMELQFLSLKRPKPLTKVYDGINEKYTLGISLDEFIEVLFNEYFKTL